MDDIEQTIVDTQAQGTFTPSAVPYHTHNGVDSPKIKSQNLSGGSSNNVAGALATTMSPVNVSASAPPTTGQALIATSPTTATWQSISSGNMNTAVYDPAGIAQQLVGTTASQSLTNKTITDNTNNVAANSLKSASTLVNVSAATAPSSGQVLTATSSTTATWQVPSAVVGNIQVALTAGEALLAGDAVSAGIYQSDGGVQYDGSAVSVAGTTSATSFSISFAVGNNSNRILIFSAATTGVINQPSYNGVLMTSEYNNNVNISNYLLAPATGTNNLTFTMNAGTKTLAYSIYSYYNVTQSAPNGFTRQATSGADWSESSAVVTAGDLVHTDVLGYNNVSIVTTTPVIGIPYNLQNTQNGTNAAPFVSAGDFAEIPLVSSTLTVQNRITYNTSSSIVVFWYSLTPVTAPTYSAVVKSNSLYTWSNRFLSYLGFAQSTVSAGASVNVTLKGVVTALSGLTPVSPYYLSDTNGVIATTPGTNTKQVGVAYSSTALSI